MASMETKRHGYSELLPVGFALSGSLAARNPLESTPLCSAYFASFPNYFPKQIIGANVLFKLDTSGNDTEKYQFIDYYNNENVCLKILDITSENILGTIWIHSS